MSNYSEIIDKDQREFILEQHEGLEKTNIY